MATHDAPLPMQGRSRHRQHVDRAARVGLLLVLVAAALGAAAGGLAVATHQPSDSVTPVVDPCPDPPCFGGGGAPSLADIPSILPVACLLLSALCGLPGLLRAVTRTVRRRRDRSRRILPFVGPLVVLVLMEVLPHVLNPCVLADAAGARLPPGCSRGEDGVDVADRFHTLDHALVGLVPAALGYRALLLRRRPDLAGRGGRAVRG